MSKRRSKENVKYWNDRVISLFEIAPEMSLLKNRYDCLKILLQETYPWIKDHDNIQLLKDIIHLDRQLRLFTEGQEVELKKEFSIEKQVELFYD